MSKYKKIKDPLIAQGNAEEFVVIKDDEVFDICLAYEDALRQGIRKFGDVPFLVIRNQPL